MVLAPSRRLPIMEQAHDRLGHKGVFATMAHISEQFWWPFMHDDIKWYVQTCHLCQTCQVQNVLILPMVAVPAPIFAKVYMCHELCFFSCSYLTMRSLLASLSLLMFSFITTSPVFLFLILCSALVRSFLSFVSLRNQRLCMVPIKGPAVPVPDDAIMASCVGTAFCAALQCTCLGLFGLLD